MRRLLAPCRRGARPCRARAGRRPSGCGPSACRGPSRSSGRSTEPTRPRRLAPALDARRGTSRRPLGERVAPVGERVDDEVGDAPLGRELDQRLQVAVGGVHAAVGDEPDQVHALGASLQRRLQHLVLGQRAVLDRRVDAREVLRDDRAGAEVEVADLGVAHLPLGQPDALAPWRSAACAGARPTARRTPACRPARPRCPARRARAPSRRGRRGRRAGRSCRAPASDDRRERLGVEGRAADQRAVDVGQREQLGARCRASASRRRGSRTGLAGLLVEALRRARARTRSPPAPARAWRSGRCRSPRSARRRSTTSGSRSIGTFSSALLDLVAQLALGVAALALLLGLADAEDRDQARLERPRDLLLQRPVGLVEVLAALGVAEDHAVDVDLGRASAPRPRR